MDGPSDVKSSDNEMFVLRSVDYPRIDVFTLLRKDTLTRIVNKLGSSVWMEMRTVSSVQDTVPEYSLQNEISYTQSFKRIQHHDTRQQEILCVSDDIHCYLQIYSLVDHEPLLQYRQDFNFYFLLYTLVLEHRILSTNWTLY